MSFPIYDKFLSFLNAQGYSNYPVNEALYNYLCNVGEVVVEPTIEPVFIESASATAFNETPQTFDMGSNTIQDLTGRTAVGIAIRSPNRSSAESVTIGGQTATKVGTEYGGINGTGADAGLLASAVWYVANGPYTDDDIVVEVESGGEFGNVGVALYHYSGFSPVEGAGSGLVRVNGAGDTDFTTSCQVGDKLLAVGIYESVAVSADFSSGMTASTGFPLTISNRQMLAGLNSSPSANQVVDITGPGGGDLAMQGLCLRPLA